MKAVETKLKTHLEAQGLGLPLKTAPSVKDVLAEITISQGGKLMGSGSLDSILDGLADRVVTMVSDLAPARASSAAGLSREQELEQQLQHIVESQS